MRDIDFSQEGDCLLYNCFSGRAIFGKNPIQKTHRPGANAIGYLAYPNPNLKNKIPESLFYEYSRLCQSRAPFKKSSKAYSTSGPLDQSVTKAQYFKKIRQIKELLAAGEVYQINYAIRFRKKFHGSAYAFFCRLIKANPTAYCAYLNCGDFQIVSASPEQLFRLRGRSISTKPIKGTAPKSGGPQALKRLLASGKERAELDMITDMERNDLGRICEYGTVRVARERALMELPNLWHTYSEVRGKLRAGIRPPEIFKALFPGGSVTGCPKLRTMEYIEKLEGMPRNIFTGSIGYLRPGFSAYRLPLIADFNIAIRTALIHHGVIEYWAGGGIVFDSDPELEYAECFLKAEKFLALL